MFVYSPYYRLKRDKQYVFDAANPENSSDLADMAQTLDLY
jgi:hypothetical protein